MIFAWEGLELLSRISSSWRYSEPGSMSEPSFTWFIAGNLTLCPTKKEAGFFPEATPRGWVEELKEERGGCSSCAGMIHNRCQDPFLICDESSTPPNVVLLYRLTSPLMKTVDETRGQLPLPTSFITVTANRDESEGRSSSDSDLGRPWILGGECEVVWSRDGCFLGWTLVISILKTHMCVFSQRVSWTDQIP